MADADELEWFQLPELDLEDRWELGKYRGYHISQILIQDPGFLLFTRHQRTKGYRLSRERIDTRLLNGGFSPDVNRMLDAKLAEDPERIEQGYVPRYAAEDKELLRAEALAKLRERRQREEADKVMQALPGWGAL